MTVTSVTKDTAALTLLVTAEYDASPADVWELWADPRKLERWWGPPMWPATVVEHELAPGGLMSYYMTSPAGERFWGWWRITSVDQPNRLTFVDGFSDATGTPDPSMPETTTIVSIEPLDGGGSRMAVESKWNTLDAMERLVAMGMVEGMTGALSQTDAILAVAAGRRGRLTVRRPAQPACRMR